MSRHIKRIEVEKHETWSSFWKKIWQSLWKKIKSIYTFPNRLNVNKFAPKKKHISSEIVQMSIVLSSTTKIIKIKESKKSISWKDKIILFIFTSNYFFLYNLYMHVKQFFMKLQPTENPWFKLTKVKSQ
jgi:hypothetical protein